MQKILQARTVSKRKKIGVIPVQATAKSRCLYKMRGAEQAYRGDLDWGRDWLCNCIWGMEMRMMVVLSGINCLIRSRRLELGIV